MEENNKTIDKDVKALQELRDIGVLTQEEFEAKVAQISASQNMSNDSKEPPIRRINHDELTRLEKLLNDGLIKEKEYTQKAAQLIGIANPGDEKKQGFSLLSWIKRNIAAVILIVVLAGALAGGGIIAQNKIKTLQGNLNYQKNQIKKLKGYEDAVVDFYLDTAVLAVDEGGHYYHRYGCPALPSYYSYYLFTPEAAYSHGYNKCPTCYEHTNRVYCTYYIEEQ